ncbi:MAG: [protein-PII] uridylyltransferase [Prosthecobacter sp.]|jgi:[protein-PII] uridylyltransferase|uniref:[protein-PII] uridylyltransferase n=1 Tax=Prosthecobacter sp. TaxID=1965333 RepID=UPI0019DC6D37|nr:[protein-PII] uridylyltransferase [Prosthecobacter sp.]MBE2284215.1 [protein-PII] uridylyltransferase [Prosthecobacter sp.]
MTEREYLRHLNKSAQAFFPPGEALPRGRADALRQAKRFLKIKEQRIKQRHRSGNCGGAEVCRMRSDVIDYLVRVLWEESVSALPEPVRAGLNVSVVAHGGYGRRVMSPGSDVDLTFMFPGNTSRVSNEVAQLIRDFLLYFYDLKFKVGHGSRSVGECINLANENIETKTALMEGRFLTGQPKAFEEFRARFDKECMNGRDEEFLKLRQIDLAARHKKQGGTPFVQEPHVKNGCGGLRDYQNLIWMTYAQHRTLNPKDLVGLGLISKSGWREVEQAYEFILRVRNEMHYTEKRAEDLLTLRLQGPVATNLGYRHKKLLRRIEALMHDYYTATRDILQRSSEIMDRFHLEQLEHDGQKKRLMGFLARKRSEKQQERFDGFIRKHERVYPEDNGIFKADPQRLMRLFLHTQQRHLRLSPDLFQLIQENFRLVDTSFRYSKANRETFETILSKKGDASRTLRQMHRVGFLGRFMPEFGALTNLVQHEFFHLYTADEHTLRTIDKLDELSDPTLKGVELFQQLFHDLQQPYVLYLALLLHDAGRAANKKTHSDESTTLAAAVCRRLQLKGERRRLLLFLVDNHLLMYRTATTKSLEDPQVIEEFVTVVRTKEYLDTLMLMTYADSKGTSDKSWSGYKEASIRQLYHSTLRFMDAPADYMKQVQTPLDELQGDVLRRLGGDFEAEVEAHFQHMPPAYFNFREADVVATHIRHFRTFFEQLIREEAAAGLLPVMVWEDHVDQGYTELTVVCWDRHLLLARISGALAAESINILSADLFQRSDNLVLDIFRICNTNFAAVTSKSARNRIEESVRKAFSGSDFDFSQSIAEKLGKSATMLDQIGDEIPQRIYLNNNLSPNQNVVEVQLVDRLGLLYDLFMAIGRLGHSVTHARINTEKGVAIDTIYIQDDHGQKITDREQLSGLADALHVAAHLRTDTQLA